MFECIRTNNGHRKLAEMSFDKFVFPIYVCSDKRLVLSHHPDKRRASGLKVADQGCDYFSCIIKGSLSPPNNLIQSQSLTEVLIEVLIHLMGTPNSYFLFLFPKISALEFPFRIILRWLAIIRNAPCLKYVKYSQRHWIVTIPIPTIIDSK